MRNDIEEIDKLIKETLTKEEAKFYEDLDEQNMLEMILGIFKGKNKWLMYLMNLMTIIFFGFFIYCVVNFFKTNENELKELIKWASGAIIFLVSVSMLKIFGWMQMDKNAIIRALKRQELLFLFKNDK